MSDYPEHEKLKALNGANNIVGDFISWLSEQGIQLARWDKFDELHPINDSIESLLANFFGIDRNILEQEKQAMLDQIRKENNRG